MSTVWAAGDYHRFATELIWHFGPELVADTRSDPGQRVLDVAAGTGNVALRAAERGATVTACDITPEQLALGRREAEARGLEIEWVEADAQGLPFADDAFDVVTSAAGAIFAPDHARRRARAASASCRPGGTIGMINFTPEGHRRGLLRRLRALRCPPAGDPPVLWGSEPYVAELLRRPRARPAPPRLRRARARRPAGLRRLLPRRPSAPPRAIEDAALRTGFPAAFAERANEGVPGGDAELRFEYLRVLARLPAHPAPA